LVDENPKAESAGSDDVVSAVFIQIAYSHLSAEGDVLACSGDGVPGPFGVVTVPTVVVNGHRIGGSRITGVMGPDALARDQLVPAVAVQVVDTSMFPFTRISAAPATPDATNRISAINANFFTVPTPYVEG
jgi:hypothetical protein